MLRIGHRGAAGHGPENTLLSIREALALEVDYVEVDVQATRDGELVLMHDKRLERTTNGSGLVRESTLAELRCLDAGRGERVPTLREAVQLVDGKAGIVVELIVPGIVAQALKELKMFADPTRIIIASFLHDEVLTARRSANLVNTLALMEAVPVDRLAFARDAEASHVGLSMDSVTGEFVGQLVSDGRKVLVHTVNDTRDLRWLQRIGVSGIVSDFPEIVPKEAPPR